MRLIDPALVDCTYLTSDVSTIEPYEYVAETNRLRAARGRASVAIEKSIRPQIKAHPEACDSSLRRRCVRKCERPRSRGVRSSVALARNVVGIYHLPQ